RPLSSAQQVGPAAWLDFKQRSPAHLLEPDARCGAYRPSGISSGRACRAAGHAATGLAAGYLSGGRFERSFLLAPAESNGRAHAQHRHRLYLSDALRFPAVASASSTRAPFLELAARQPARSPRHRPPDGTRNCPAKTTNSCRPRELERGALYLFE